MRLATLLLAGLLLVPSAAFAPRRVGAADAPPAPGAPAPVAAAPTETTFLADLDRVRTSLSVGRAADALKMLVATLETHREKDYAFAKRVAVEDLARRISFRCECPLPAPQTVVKGKLKKFLSSSGAIEIVYTAGQPDDFEKKGDGALFFPVHFRGPYTITVKGDSYPRPGDPVPMIQVATSLDPKSKQTRAWVLGFGVPPLTAGTRWVPPRIAFAQGDDHKVLVEKPSHPAQVDRPFRLDASVTSTRVTGSINGTTIGSVPKTDGEYGAALIAVRDWREIAIAGVIEPSWIQAKLDAVVDDKRKAFEDCFDVKKVLPAWLFAAPKGPVAADPKSRLLPKGLTSMPIEHVTAYLEAMTAILRAEFREALAIVERMRAAGAPPAATGTLAAQALLGLDEPTKALAEVEKALAADPGSIEALTIQARIQLRLGRDEALTKTVEAIRAHPDAGPEAREVAATLFLLAGRLDDARKLSEDAARAGVRSPGLERIERVIVRAQSGPEWPKTYEYKTTNYHVLSDIDADTCRKAAEVLEDALADFRGAVKSLRAETRRQYRVYLFSGRAGFDSYTADANSLVGRLPDQVAGLYSPILKQLLIWNLPNRDEMMRTVRHEAFHQYLDRLLPDPPVWFNEGLAVYFEGLKRVAGTLRTNLVRDDYVRALKATTLIPMAEFVTITPSRFYGDASRCYAQAWLLAHLLRSGTPRHGELYRGLLSRLETAAGSEAVRATFDAATLRALDADLAAHLRDLATAK